MQKIKHSQRKLLSVLYRQAGSIRLYNDFDYRRKIKFFSSAIAEFHTLTFLEQFRLLFLKGLEFAKKHPQYAALADQFPRR